jgi:PAS domain S-box-containing protein
MRADARPGAGSRRLLRRRCIIPARLPISTEERYRRTLDSLLEGFQIVSDDWTYFYVNPAAAAHGQSTPERLHGRVMWEAYPGIDRTPMFAVLRRCMTQRVSSRIENEFVLPDGTSRWFELRIEPVPEGLCIHSIDIDERKRAEAALARLNQELEARVAQRTRALRQVNEDLEAFAYSVSHDLRAPLRHIGGFATLLEQRAGAALDETARRHLSTIVEAAARMTRLIDDLLLFSRTGRAEFRPARVALAPIVAEAQREVLAAAGGARVEITVAPLPEVVGDAALLKQVFVNLIGNAVKYSQPSPSPRVEVGQSGPPGREAVIFVRDNGVGFDMQYAHKLFGVFQRLHGSDEFEGTGIGLANVRRIVGRHGGRVWGESAPHRGATFYVALPTRFEEALA